MEAWYLPIALATLCLASLVLGVMSAESRPGFAWLKTSVKERWFPHSRKD